MEQEIGTVLINGDDDFNKWENNMKDLNQLVQDEELFEKEGVADEVEPIDGTYKVIPKEYKGKINTKLKGTFYANSHGKVYYEHGQGPGYSDEEIDDLIKHHDFIPVATAEELNNVRSATLETYGEGTKWKDKYTGGLDKKYIQVKEIDLSAYSGEGWNPIGTSSESFTGTYDGGNDVITDLEIKGEGESLQGLFGYTNGATISNVGLIDNKVAGGDNTGGLVGGATTSTVIENSYATGSVEGTGRVGGLVGVANTKSVIKNSYAEGSVTGNESVGGLVGRAEDSTIENSYATVSVKGSGVFSHVGGLVGEAFKSTNINNSYAIGSVEGKNEVGGLVGWAGRNIVISNSYATGEVTGSRQVGGLVGWIRDSTKISNSYATGSVTGNDSVGGLVGEAYSGNTIENSYATGSVTGPERVGGLVGYAKEDNTISNSYSTGSVEGEDDIGGLVGDASTNTKISNSYATGLVKGGDDVGGLVGSAGSYWGDTTISNSYATGAVEGTGRVGGLVGSAKFGNISSSYATGKVTGSTVGGLVGFVNSGTTVISTSYWDKETTKQPYSRGQEASFGKSTEDMKKQETYSGWDFVNVWKITPGNYPTLR